jgi:LmbE family N-acetylglucosaminyl deacetylase
MNILAITAHPDDVEELCGGTLVKCVQRGDNVTVCHVCNGNMGHEVIMPDELRLIRRKEAQNSGKIGGFKVVTCDIGDLKVNSGDMEQRDMIVDVIREAQPDLIITHAPEDYCSDHKAVSEHVFAAAFSATCPHYKTKVDKVAAITPIYYADTYSGLNFIPTEYVDISDVIETKIDMINCHESQILWLRDHDHIDYPETVRACSRYRGIQAGVQYAEGFRQCLVSPRVTAKRLLP